MESDGRGELERLNKERTIASTPGVSSGCGALRPHRSFILQTKGWIKQGLIVKILINVQFPEVNGRWLRWAGGRSDQAPGNATRPALG